MDYRDNFGVETGARVLAVRAESAIRHRKGWRSRAYLYSLGEF